MALSTCAEIVLSSLQNVFSTSVGVGFAYPILSQIIEVKNEHTLRECDRVLRLKGQKGADIAYLGARKNQFQFKLSALSKLNTHLTMLAAIIGIVSFVLLVFSSLNPLLCISQATSFLICGALSLPFAVGVFQLLRWYDAHAELYGAITYLRGDYKWSGKSYKP